MRSVACAALACVGCGRIAFDVSAGDGGALDDANATRDALDDAGPELDALMLGPFGTPVQLTTLSTGMEDDPTLTGDGLEIYFESTRTGGVGNSDLWYSTRASTSVAFAAPALVAGINSALDDEHPGISPDGLTLWFTSNRAGGEGSYDIWVTTRVSRVAAWSSPTQVPELSSAGNDEAVEIDPTNLQLVMAIGPNSGGEELYAAVRSSPTMPWSTPFVIPGVDINAMGSTDSGGVLRRDGRALYFNGARTGISRIYVATRPSMANPFGPVTLLSELDIGGTAGDPWVSFDERTVVYQAFGNLYQATR